MYLSKNDIAKLENLITSWNSEGSDADLINEMIDSMPIIEHIVNEYNPDEDETGQYYLRRMAD